MKQKNGISLIVLVVVIIIMLIISGAVIISLTNTNIMDMGENAVQKHNQQAVEEAIRLEYNDLLISNLGKVSGIELAEKLKNLSITYTEMQNIRPGNGKVYYTLTLTGKEYQIMTATGEIAEYEDKYEKVIGSKDDWIRNGSTITGYKGENLKDIIVPNVLPDANGNEIKITDVTLKGIDFQGTLTISSNLIINAQSLVGCENLKELIVGNGVDFVTKLSYKGTFGDCINLEKVIMGENIIFSDGYCTYQGEGKYNLFYNCPNLKQVTVQSISKIVRYTFKNVGSALQGEIIINEGVTGIGENAFQGCSNIIRVSLPETLTAINSAAFSGCSGLQGELIIRDNVSLGYQAFTNCSGITRVKIGNNIDIPYSSFIGCTNLREVEIGDNALLETLYTYQGTFRNCTNLEKVTIGENVKFINNDVLLKEGTTLFYNCPNLKNVTVGSISEVCDNTFINVGAALQGKIIINEGVTVIRENAFKGCSNVTSVSLPETLTTIKSAAFNGCSSLQGELIIRDNVILGGGAFTDCSGITKLKIGNNIDIPIGSFSGCSSLKQIEIGNDVKLNTVYTIQGSFRDCTNLEKVTMGENVKFINNFNDVLIKEKMALFYNCPNLKNITVGSISEISNNIFMNVGSALQEEVVINEGVTTISSNAFKGCSSITSVSLPSTLTTIKSAAFNGCTGVNNFSVNMTSEAFANVTKGSGWNTGIPVEITYLQQATE